MKPAVTRHSGTDISIVRERTMRASHPHAFIIHRDLAKRDITTPCPAIPSARQLYNSVVDYDEGTTKEFAAEV